MTSTPPPGSTLTTYRNPVLPGWNAQPSVCNVPGKGYFVATSSASFAPAVPVYHSTDLFTWELVGHAIHAAPGSSTTATNGSNGSTCNGSAASPIANGSTNGNGAYPSGSGTSNGGGKSRDCHTRGSGYWSPCIRYIGGRWYVVVVHESEEGRSRLLITSTRDIFDTHSWTTPVEVTELSGQEPDLFFDAGKTYISYTSSTGSEEPQLFITPINPDTGAVLEPTAVLYTGEHTAARLLKCAGWYYLILDSEVKQTAKSTSGKSSGEQAGTRVFRSKTSPANGGFREGFEDCPHNPVLFNGDHAEVRGTSRLSLVRGERGWTAIFHAIRGSVSEGQFTPLALGHETYMANAAWKDGWPVINDGLTIGVTGDAEQMRWLPEVDEFEDVFDGELSYVWSARNTVLSTSPSTNLTIRPSSSTAEMLLRQSSPAVDFETNLIPGEGMAGILVRVGDRCAKLGIRGSEIVHEVDGKQTVYPLTPSGVYTLRIIARPGYHELQLDESTLRVSFPLTNGHGALLGVFATAEARIVRAGWRRVEV